MFNIKKTWLWIRARLIYYELYNSFVFMRKIRRKRADRSSVMIMVDSLYGGGAERVACNTASVLAKDYHVVMVYYVEKGRSYPLDPEVECISLAGFKVASQGLGPVIKRYIKLIKKKKRVKASLSFLYFMNGLNVETKTSEVVICSERNNPSKNEPDHMQAIRRIYENADWVVFQSSIVQNLFGERVKDHSCILPNPVSVECECAAGSRRRVVTAGRLHPQKNQKMLIRAFARFHEKHPEYTLSVYGDGTLKDELQEVIRSMKLEGCVYLHGNVEHIHREIADAEMFVLSSNYEGLSNALLEAMMMGLPCISTACEGSTDVIQNGVNGLLTEVGSEEQLLKAMLLYAEDPEFRKAAAIRGKQTAGSFRREVVMTQWGGLIRRLIEQKNDPVKQQCKDKEPRILSWNDLSWQQAALSPEIVYMTETGQKLRQAGAFRKKRRAGRRSVPALTKGRNAKRQGRGQIIQLQAPSGDGKVTDCGNDRLFCIYTEIPAPCDLTFEAEIEVDSFLHRPGPKNQESFGIFLRDTMEPDPFTGEYYSNMASVGGYYGRYNFFGRSGITADDIGHVRNFYLYRKVNEPGGAFRDRPLHYMIGSDQPVRLRLFLEKKGDMITARLQDASGTDLLSPSLNGGSDEAVGAGGAVYSDGACSVRLPGAFSERDRSRYYLGFQTAAGSGMLIDRNTVRIILTETAGETAGSGAAADETGVVSAEKSYESGTVQEICGSGNTEKPNEKSSARESSGYDGPEGPADEANDLREDVSPAEGRRWVVSPDGRAGGRGTDDDPMDIDSALASCRPGDTVWLKTGMYSCGRSVIIHKEQSGACGQRKHFTGETGDAGRVILDFGGSENALVIRADFWDVSDICVTRGYGIKIEGSYNRIRACCAYRNLETGILIRHPDNNSPQSLWPRGNSIEDCLSFENRDAAECNADGFACKVAAGSGNRFRNCVSWLNTDDGFDLFTKNRAIGSVSIEQCQSYLNGYQIGENGKLIATAGNGNGFKLGGSGLAVKHEAKDCTAGGNRQNGFSSNSNPFMSLERCTAYQNGHLNCYYYYYAADNTRPESNIRACSFGDIAEFKAEELLDQLRDRYVQ